MRLTSLRKGISLSDLGMGIDLKKAIEKAQSIFK